MRIALVAPYPIDRSTPRGGVESVVTKLVDHFLSRGHECHIFAPSSDFGIVETPAPRLTIHRLPKTWLPGAIEFWLVTPWKIRRAIQKLKPDIVHVHGASVWAAGSPLPAVLTIHGIPEREIAHRNPVLGTVLYPLINAVEALAFARVKNLILISPYVKELRHLRPSQRIWNVANPIDPLFFQRKNVRSEEKERIRLVWVGNAGVRKNLRLMVNLAEELVKRNADIHVDVIGVEDAPESTYVAKCKEQIDALGISRMFQFHGKQPQALIISKFDQATALVMTSLQETAPCVVSEALARGLYVVAPNRFGLPYMIPDDRYGFLYDPDEPIESIADRMLILLVGRASGNRCIRVAASLQYQSERVGDATLGAYEEIVNA